MVKPVWILISLFLALGVFLAVGANALISGDDLLWVVGKAIASFVACWLVLKFLGDALLALLQKQGSVTDDARSTTST